jgi:hypothetical protein
MMSCEIFIVKSELIDVVRRLISCDPLSTYKYKCAGGHTSGDAILVQKMPFNHGDGLSRSSDIIVIYHELHFKFAIFTCFERGTCIHFPMLVRFYLYWFLICIYLQIYKLGIFIFMSHNLHVEFYCK